MSRTLRQFEFVMEIAKWKSISKAADSLHLAQPTLSKYLQKLEGELGVELFDRTTIPIKLTNAGEKYVLAGRKVIDAEHQFQKELDDLKSNKNGIVKVGISPSRAPYILPSIVREYKKVIPDGKIIIKERNTAQLNAELQRGDLDLIISLRSDGTRGFAHEYLFSESTLLAVPEEMASLEAVNILREQPIISIGSGLRLWRVLNSILDDVGGNSPQIECQSIESALSLVKEGFGAMIVPSYIVKYGTTAQHKGVIFKKLPATCYHRLSAELERDVCLFYRKEQFLTGVERTFIDACIRATRSRES